MVETDTRSETTIELPETVTYIAEKLRNAGKECFLVGGAVRDALLGRKTDDYDLATNAKPAEVKQLFRRTVDVGIEHGTVVVLYKGDEVEVTTYRSDGVYSDGRRPDTITFAETIEEDLSRRDFTINALALDVLTGDLIDLFKGESDLHAKCIRTVGNPHERFNEDGLRVLRACRFAAKLGFRIEEKTFEAIADSLDTFKNVSPERMRMELDGILLTEAPFHGIELMRKTGILSIMIPELDAGYGVKQNRFHAYDVYYHNLYTCKAVSKQECERSTRLLRLAALFHDIGKSYTKQKVEKQEEEVFYNHEVVGAAIARKIMRRLKYSNADVKYVDLLIRNHMFYYQDEWTDGAVRRFMRKVGVENIKALLTLRDADRVGNGKKKPGESEAIIKLLRRIDKIIEAQNAITVKDLAINGNDIMQEFGVSPGPVIGKTLNALLERILDDPTLNERETLLPLAQEAVEAATSNAGNTKAQTQKEAT